MIKKFLQSMWDWKTMVLIGIFIMFISISWYAFEYEGDDESIKYAVGIVTIVGLFFIIGSYFSFTKKQKREKQQNENK